MGRRRVRPFGVAGMYPPDDGPTGPKPQPEKIVEAKIINPPFRATPAEPRTRPANLAEGVADPNAAALENCRRMIREAQDIIATEFDLDPTTDTFGKPIPEWVLKLRGRLRAAGEHVGNLGLV